MFQHPDGGPVLSWRRRSPSVRCCQDVYSHLVFYCWSIETTGEAATTQLSYITATTKPPATIRLQFLGNHMSFVCVCRDLSLKCGPDRGYILNPVLLKSNYWRWIYKSSEHSFLCVWFGKRRLCLVLYDQTVHSVINLTTGPHSVRSVHHKRFNSTQRLRTCMKFSWDHGSYERVC